MGSSERVIGRWGGPTFLAILFFALLLWSWRKWTDVHIDFGNELYIAWRLSEGEALYRDIAHRNGPFSHYANALWFTLFGVSIRTLVIVNLAVLGAICAMTWRVFARSCDRFTATAAVATLLVGFAFGQYAGIANFNYVTPYHHFQTHGLALSLVMLLALERAAHRAAPAALATAGAGLGALFLTKAELFVPGGVLAAAGLWAGRVNVRGAAIFLGAALLLPACFGVLLAEKMPPAQALAGLAGNWSHLAEILSDPFYRGGAGLDDVPGNAGRAALALLAIAGFAAFASTCDRLARPLQRPALVAALAAVLFFAGLAAVAGWLPWLHLARALPFTSLAGALWLGLRFRRLPDGPERERLLPLLLWSVYSAALLAKLGLAARFHQYGFVLAMPATLLLVAAGTHGLPAALRARAGGGPVARALAVAVLAVFLGFLFAVSERHYAPKVLEIGSGADAILAKEPGANPRPEVIRKTLEYLETSMRPGETLLVLPEGISLNYWLRRDNPSRFDLFLPTEIQAFGEQAMLDDLEAHPPDVVVFAHRHWAEFGVGPFGRDPRNGRRLRAWVDANYTPVVRFGARPFTSVHFGTVVLERSLR